MRAFWSWLRAWLLVPFTLSLMAQDLAALRAQVAATAPPQRLRTPAAPVVTCDSCRRETVAYVRDAATNRTVCPDCHPVHKRHP
mgnify:CR=1 FL=1